MTKIGKYDSIPPTDNGHKLTVVVIVSAYLLLFFLACFGLVQKFIQGVE